MMKIIVSVMYWSLQCQQILMLGIVDLAKKLSMDFQNVSSNMYTKIHRLYSLHSLHFCSVLSSFDSLQIALYSINQSTLTNDYELVRGINGVLKSITINIEVNNNIDKYNNNCLSFNFNHSILQCVIMKLYSLNCN